MNRLKESTIKGYSVKQLAKHADRYQDKIGADLFRFDFAYDIIYKKEGDIYTVYIGLYESSYNKMMMEDALNTLYCMESNHE